MKSRIKFEVKQNGNLVRVETLDDKIYQGAVGVTEYFLRIAENISGDYKWINTDSVFIAFERPDGKKASLKMAHNGLDGWEYTSSGWETDVDISGGSDLKIAFIGKRYSQINPSEKSAITKTTQEVTQTIHPSGEFIVGDIELDEAQLLWDAVNLLEVDKVGRYDVENIDYVPAIVYDQDGLKSPQNIYYNFESNVQDIDGTTNLKQGAILVVEANGAQTEFFITNDKRLFLRNTGGTFKSASLTDLQAFTYSKSEIVGYLAYKQDKTDLALQTASKTTTGAINELWSNKQDKTDLALNTTSKTVVGAINELKSGTFVNLIGDQTIDGVKTFVESPIVPSSSSDQSAINRGELLNRTYTKEQIDTKFVNYGFDTEQEFLDWLDGNFARADGKTKADLLIGNKIIIKESRVNNYQVVNAPVVDINDFKVLVEDHKDLAEIAFTPKGNITETNADDALMEVNRKTDLKSQIAELANLVIEPSDWVADGANYVYNYEPAEFTNDLEQELSFSVASDVVYNDLQNAGIDLKAYEILTGAKFVVNDLPAFNIELVVKLITYTDTVLEADELTAQKVSYDNTGTGLLGTNLQVVVGELNNKIGGLEGDLDDLDGEVVDLGIEVNQLKENNYYDTIIRTQAEFEEMLADATWNDAKRVLIVGKATDYKVESPNVFKIPATVEIVKGASGDMKCSINIESVIEISFGGTFYARIATDNGIYGVYPAGFQTTISNIGFKMKAFPSANYSISAFVYKGFAIKDCGFFIREADAHYYPIKYLFKKCNSIENCLIINYASDYTPFENAFDECENLSKNIIVLKKHNLSQTAFNNCKVLNANDVSSEDNDGASHIAYKDCSYGSNNRASKVLTITDNCTKWSSSND